MSTKFILKLLSGLGDIGEDMKGIEILSKDFEINKITGHKFEPEEEAADTHKHRYEDSGEELEEMSVASDENERIQHNLKGNKRKRQSEKSTFGVDPFKQMAPDDEDYEDNDNIQQPKDDGDVMEEEYQEGTETTSIRKQRRKAIPKDLKIENVLETIVGSRTDTIYKFSDLNYPEHRLVLDSLQNYAYAEFIRNPDEVLQKYGKRLSQAEDRNKEYLEIFQQVLEKQEHDQDQQQKLQDMLKKRQEENMGAKPSTSRPSFDFQIRKDQFEDPFQISRNYTKYTKISSHEWFEELEQHLLKHMRSSLYCSTQEIEEEIKPDHLKKAQAPLQNADASGINYLKKSLGMGSSSLHSAKHISRRGTYDFHSDTPSRAETPSREVPNLHSFLAHLDSSSHHNMNDDEEETMNFGESVIEKSKMLENTVNAQDYMKEYQAEDEKFLADFNTSLIKGKQEASKNSHLDIEIESLGPNNARPQHKDLQYYEEGLIKIPFRSEMGNKIFEYEEENIPQDLLHAGTGDGAAHPYKKLKLDKRIGKINISADNLDLTYCNNHLLKGSWKEFFASDKPTSKDLEKEYSNILIDLNDRSLFYNKINPVIYGLQKYQPKRDINLMDLKSSSQTIGKGENMSQVSASMLKTGDGFADPDSMSTIGAAKSQSLSHLKKVLRIELVKQGKDPDKVTNVEELIENCKKRAGEKGPDHQDDHMLKNILGFGDDFRKKKRRLVPIQDSKVADDFEFNEFLIKDSDFVEFHRPDLTRNRYKQGHSWKIEIVKTSKEKKKESSVGDNNNEKVNSFEHFKNQRRLSLREGTFSLFEFIEETPLIIPNVGMGCKISRYVYPKRIISKLPSKKEQTITQMKESKQSEEKIVEDKVEEKSREEFFEYIQAKLGSNGLIQYMQEGSQEKHPLIGNITNEKYPGFTALENNLYVAPIFPQKPKMTDFVLVRHVSPEGYTKFFLRKIENLYTVGQIEPKREVFTPHSRALRDFFKKCLQFIIKNKFNKGEAVDLRELSKIFPTYNEHNLRKQIRDFGGEQDPKDNKRFSFNKDKVDSDHEAETERTEGAMKPDDACLYERMHASRIRLKNLGLEELKSCDKINTVKSRFIKRIKEDANLTQEQKARKCLLAKYVAEELQLTAWNLSQSFSDAKQKKGRLYLTGFGDPTSGHGGYSYVKFPMKTSRYDKDEKKNKDNDKANMITGTDADLRSLENKTMEAFILKYRKINPELLSKLHRWDKKNILTDIAKEHPDDPELKKYVRVNRITTKEQKQKYQKEINKLFMNLIDNMSKQTSEDIQSDDDWELECDVDKEAEREFKDMMRSAELDKAEGEGEGEDDGNDGTSEEDEDN